jgi:putative flippase GtrA
MARISALLKGSAGAFLICGTLAAAVNWLARIILSPSIGFQPAVIWAYAIGMVVGFTLYKSFVWPNSRTSLKQQVLGFLMVNAVSAVIVLASSVGLLALLSLVVERSPLTEALAHGTAIAIGAAANYLGHGSVTFKR